MSTSSRLRLFYFLHLSKPASDRLAYRELRRLEARKIVELGIGTGERAVRMIQLLSESCDPREIHYTGIDLFEDRPAGGRPGISLREAHCLLKATGARIRLVPGTPFQAMSQVANALGTVDAILFSATTAPEQLAPIWFYIPRLLGEKTIVLQESMTTAGETTLKLLARDEIATHSHAGLRRAA